MIESSTAGNAEAICAIAGQVRKVFADTTGTQFVLLQALVRVQSADLVESQEYAKKERSLESVYDTIGDLFEGHPDLQAEFVNFLPKKMQSKMNGSRANRTASTQHRVTPTNKPQSIDEHGKGAAGSSVGAATSADRALKSRGDRGPLDQPVVGPTTVGAMPEPKRRDTAPVRPCKPFAAAPATSVDATGAADDTRNGSPSGATKLDDASAVKKNDAATHEVSAADRNETSSTGDSAAEHDDPGSKSHDGSPGTQRTDPDTGGESAAKHSHPDHPSPTRPVPETTPKRLKTELSTGSSTE